MGWAGRQRASGRKLTSSQQQPGSCGSPCQEEEWRFNPEQFPRVPAHLVRAAQPSWRVPALPPVCLYTHRKARGGRREAEVLGQSVWYPWPLRAFCLCFSQRSWVALGEKNRFLQEVVQGAGSCHLHEEPGWSSYILASSGPAGVGEPWMGELCVSGVSLPFSDK